MKHAFNIGRLITYLAVFLCLSCSKNANTIPGGVSMKVPETLIFKWPVPVKFQVEESIEKEGKLSKVRRTVLMTETNGELRLEWLKLELMMIDEHDFTRPPLNRIAEEILRSTAKRISHDEN